tara:strand:+ start:375 stop:518 length:144 start_codon:yes stop_codon:yes gene_type:complete
MNSTTLVLKVPSTYTTEQIATLVANTKSQLPEVSVLVVPCEVEISWL